MKRFMRGQTASKGMGYYVGRIRKEGVQFLDLYEKIPR